MRRCLANLVDNAVKYGNSARVHLELASEFVTIRIDDDGPGVQVADQERVFAPFERLDSSRNSDSGGTGLGLSIARTIARAHGGDVTIENRREGGLRVTLSLPRPS
jgi:signal transduction histidine kinase